MPGTDRREPAAASAPAARPALAARLSPWVLRAAWVVLPFTAGAAVGRGLADASRAVQLTATVLAWVAWALGLLATLVPHPLSLTAVRVLSPLAAATALWGVVAGDGSAGEAVLALTPALVGAVLAFSVDLGHWAVNGPAYPNERRFLLRAPGPLLLGPLQLSWALACAGVLAGPLLLAARVWVLGGAAVAVGVPVCVVLLRSLHALARRFVVFVPAGFVLHDLMSLREPVLFPRLRIDAIRPAPADSDSLDLTQGAPGLAVEVLLREKTEVTIVRRGGRESEAGGTARFLFTPTLPGRLLAEARGHRIPTG